VRGPHRMRLRDPEAWAAETDGKRTRGRPTGRPLFCPSDARRRLRGMKGQEKPKKLQKKVAQKTLKEKRSQKRAKKRGSDFSA
jgi:hypothetical protein